jgi:hypothetical protein
MRLKQGVGRLIRTHKDKGMVAILDARLTTKRYGRHVLSSLPPMPIIRNLSELISLDHYFAKHFPVAEFEVIREQEDASHLPQTNFQPEDSLSVSHDIRSVVPYQH